MSEPLDWYCPFCGTVNGNADKHCGSCGRKNPEIEARQADNDWGPDWCDGTEDLNDMRVSKPYLFEDDNESS